MDEDWFKMEESYYIELDENEKGIKVSKNDLSLEDVVISLQKVADISRNKSQVKLS